MAGRTRRAAAQPEPEVAEVEETGGRNLRGPSPLHEAHAAYLTETYGVDITAEQVYLAQATRKEFRTTEGSGYEEALDKIEAAREEKTAAKAKRAADKEAAQAEEEPEETPAPKQRGRRKAAAVEAPAEEETPAPAKRTRRAKAAPATETAEETAPATPTKRRAKAPF